MQTRPKRARLWMLAWFPAALAACAPPPQSGADVRPVRAVTVAPFVATTAAELAGEVRPRIESRVGFQVSGRIARRLVEVGQGVQAGQVLAVLDSSDYELGLAAARAQAAAAQVDRDQQRLDYRRFAELSRQGFISGADLERRKANLDAAEARFTQAAAQADVSGNQAAYSTLRAPAPGVVTALDAEAGQVVTAGQSVVRIARTEEKEVAVSIPEGQLEALRRISDVRVRLWAGDKELRGKVREIAPMADPATRTYPARITLADAPSSVALGMTATVMFVAPGGSSVITLPLQSLLRDGDATFVWLLDRRGMTVQRAPITLASVAGNEVVVASGVAPGDTVVTAGVHLLKPGQKVKLLEESGLTAGSPVGDAAGSGKGTGLLAPAAAVEFKTKG
ncbi:MAG TPA: efflux RND transporter periplasmic adaptor subunit [Burkholderiaceae bacterium]|nr:efflux RND transporter periplasmic adaptor subunit [Burkholderiaceae bacterium]